MNKTYDELLDSINQEDSIRTKLARMETAKKAGDRAELKKIASSIDFNGLNGPTLDRITELLDVQKIAADTPGLPGDASPAEEPAPAEEKPAIENATPSEEGQKDPNIDQSGDPAKEQAPGTSPSEEPKPEVMPELGKDAFVRNTLLEGMNEAVVALQKKAQAKRDANPFQKVAKLMEELVAEYGEEKVAELVTQFQKEGMREAVNTVYGGK